MKYEVFKRKWLVTIRVGRLADGRDRSLIRLKFVLPGGNLFGVDPVQTSSWPKKIEAKQWHRRSNKENTFPQSSRCLTAISPK